MTEDRIDALLVDCLAEPSGEWHARVDTLCAAHPDLATELRRRFERLMELGIVDAVSDLNEPAAPQRFGHYRLLREIGGGGMGVVYEARDDKLGRKVALKVIRGERLFFAGARERFAREMQAASRLDHPNLCPIYEAGEIDGVQYLAMRYIEGETLAARLSRRSSERAAAATPSRGTKDRSDVIALAEKIARALHAAHEAGLVHRDVKPANVLIRPDGEPVLVDFGLARDTGLSEHDLTLSGERLGTPAYMAPEQVSGRGVVDRRADVYGLGVTLYECLTLQRPFDSVAREDLFRQILTEPPRDARSFDRGISSELATVVGVALEKDPNNRFATALEFAEELRRIREHEPIRSRRPGLMLRTVRWTQRNRAAAGILTSVALGLVIALALLFRSTRAENRFLALAWLEAAAEVEDENPELAFKCAREALRRHDDPRIIGRIQDIMAQLRENTIVATHSDLVTRTVYSPGGRFLLVTGLYMSPVLIDRHTDGEPQLSLPETGWSFRDPVHPFSFSPDGRELALGAWDGGVYRFDLSGAEPRARDVLRAETSGRACRSVCYSTDGSRILASHWSTVSVWRRDGTLDWCREGSKRWQTAAFVHGGRIAGAGELWDEDGQRVRSIPMPHQASHILVDGERVWITSRWGVFRTYDATGNPLPGARDLPRPDSRCDLTHAELDPTGTRLLLTFQDGRIRILDSETLELAGEWFTENRRTLQSARFSPDGTRIAAGQWGGKILIWSVDGRLRDVLRGHQGEVPWVEWSPDGDQLASASWDGTARVWSLEAYPGVPAYAGHGWPDVAVSPSGQRVVFTSETGALYICDASGDLVARQHAEVGFSHVAFTEHGEKVVACEVDNVSKRFFVWDLSRNSDDPAPVRELVAPSPLGTSPPALLADGRWLLHLRNQLFAWRPSESPEPLLPDRTTVYAARASQDGQRIIGGSWAGVMVLAADGSELWRSPESGPMMGTLSRDSQHALVYGSGRTAYLWDFDAPEPAEFEGHQNSVVHAVFSTDEQRVATASRDGSIRIWDRSSRRTILGLPAPGVRKIAFTSTGQLVSASQDGTVRWWWLDVESLRRAVEALGIDGLTGAERERLRHLLGS